MLVVRWQASRPVYYWMPLRVRDVLIDSGCVTTTRNVERVPWVRRKKNVCDVSSRQRIA